MITWLNEKLWIKDRIRRQLAVPPEKILFVEHHLSHAASAFFCSPFEEAAVLTIDGVGEWTSATMGVARRPGTAPARTASSCSRSPASRTRSASYYSAFTAWLGFEVNDGEYKVMGMAPYGKPEHLDKVRKVIDFADDGSFWLNMDYFSFHHSMEHTFSRKFEALFGEPRTRESEFLPARPACRTARRRPAIEANQYYADVAASVQTHDRRGDHQDRQLPAPADRLEAALHGRRRRVQQRRQRPDPARDAASRSSTSSRRPATRGGALGAALYAYHVLLGKPRKFVMDHAYWGRAYGEAEIKAALEARGVSYEYVGDEDKLAEVCAAELASGRVLGWYQGRFEWGPRALGNRSIIADPRREEMKDVVNTKIKFREPFRPFAPSILAEQRRRLLRLATADGAWPKELAKFMLAVMPVAEDKQEQDPGGQPPRDRPAPDGPGRDEPALPRADLALRGADRRAGHHEHLVQPARRADRHHARQRA